MSFFSNIINFILPPRCAICGQVLDSNKGLCNKCISQIEFLKEPICYRCGQPIIDGFSQKGKHLYCGNCLKKSRHIFRMSRSAYIYDDFSKKLILDFKFYDKTDLASLLAKMMYVAGNDIFEAGVDIIVPVPLHYTRIIKRRYNQSSLIAKELGKLTGIKVEYNVLTKHKRTKPQVECNGLERLNNVKGAFEVKHLNKLQGKRILLIDDVLTTGSTLKECASAIKKSKPKSIDCLTVARACI